MIDFIAGPYGFLLLLALSVICLVLLPVILIFDQRRKAIVARLEPAGHIRPVQSGPGQPAAQSSLLERIGRHFVNPEDEKGSGLRLRLIHAGFLTRSAPFVFTGIRVFLMLALPMSLMALQRFLPFTLEGQNVIFALCGMTAFGFILPSLQLDRMIETRQQHYRNGFPDLMDLLVACVEAGLSLDAAIMRITDELRHRHAYLAAQLHLMSMEVRAGRDRNQAWRNLAERLGLEEAQSLALMLKQSENLGTSIGETLRVFASDMRERRMLLAEEKALALPAKLVLPLILFVFPSLLTVLILPAIVRMMSVLEQMG